MSWTPRRTEPPDSAVAIWWKPSTVLPWQVTYIVSLVLSLATLSGLAANRGL